MLLWNKHSAEANTFVNIGQISCQHIFLVSYILFCMQYWQTCPHPHLKLLAKIAFKTVFVAAYQYLQSSKLCFFYFKILVTLSIKPRISSNQTLGYTWLYNMFKLVSIMETLSFTNNCSAIKLTTSTNTVCYEIENNIHVLKHDTDKGPLMHTLYHNIVQTKCSLEAIRYKRQYWQTGFNDFIKKQTLNIN